MPFVQASVVGKPVFPLVNFGFASPCRNMLTVGPAGETNDGCHSFVVTMMDSPRSLATISLLKSEKNRAFEWGDAEASS